MDQRPPPLAQPVPLWEDGQQRKMVDAATASVNGYMVLDLGDEWTPYIFTEGVAEVEPAVVESDSGEAPALETRFLPNSYRQTYLSLAREQWPKDHHGERAQKDRYLELYGIMPTLSVLRKRFHATSKLRCADELDLQPLHDFTEGYVTYRTNQHARRSASDYHFLKSEVKRIMRKQGVASIEEISWKKLDWREQDRVRRFKKQGPRYLAVRAAQQRLKCEGYFRDVRRYTRGGLDWPTHNALAEFERRHRIYSWGYLGRATLRVLRMTPVEAEREAVLRVLTERAMHAAGVVEDGSMSTLPNGEPRTFLGVDGEQHEIPNLEQQLREAIIEAFGLQTPESTWAWLEGLGKLEADKERIVAFPVPDLPEYYDGNMQLALIYDRGDVWYEFPYTPEGKQKSQPVSRRPRTTVFTEYQGQRIPLARFGTTIGGWRSEFISNVVWWKYKESPVGPRMWRRIVAAPVWLPPDSTPPRELLRRKEKRKADEPEFEVNYHETGPSYASAYGLVAAYHEKFFKRPDGEVLPNGDEGIRTHGSVDYMSIMRRHSHGCHRLHNHIAVRLMSFVLAHRPHKRVGQQRVLYEKVLEHEEQTYDMLIQEGGYVFMLDEPLFVEVLEGRIRGKLDEPVTVLVPKYDKDVGAYLMPDGGAVELRGKELVSVPVPVQADAGIEQFLLPLPSEQSSPASGVPNAPPPTLPATMALPLPAPAVTSTAPTPAVTAPAAVPQGANPAMPVPRKPATPSGVGARPPILD